MRKFLVIALFAVFLLISGAFAENVTQQQQGKVQVFMIGSSSACKSYVEIAKTITNETNGTVKFQIRSTTQMNNLKETDIKNLVNSSDIILAEWGTELGNSLYPVVTKYPSIIDNKIFLVFESDPKLVKLSQIGKTKCFENVSDKDIGTYDTVGSLIGACHDGDVNCLLSYKQKYPNNKGLHAWIDAAVYYAAKGKDNLINQVKWALKKLYEIRGWIFPQEWEPEPVKLGFGKEFLYRDGEIFSKEDYFKKYPLDPKKPTVAILTYLSYSGEVYAENAFQQIIDKLVEKGMNVIPIVGTWSDILTLNETQVTELAKTLLEPGQNLKLTAVKGIGNYTDSDKICGVRTDTKAKVYEFQILDKDGRVVKEVKISNIQPANVYSALVKFLTDANNTVQYEFEPWKYPVKCDAIIDLLPFLTGSSPSWKQVLNFFNNSNVPVFRAMVTTGGYRTLGQWLVSDEGFSWAAVYWQCAQPEMQGQIEPIAIGVGEIHRDNDTGAEWDVTIPIPDRIEKLANRVYNWCLLKHLPNKDKKIAIVYYNYPPGKQNIGASYLNVPETIINILKRLKQEGYNVSGIPKNADELVSILLERGINTASWAKGFIEKLANNPNTILWPLEEYKKWFKKLNPIAQKEVIEGPTGYIEELTKAAVEYIKKGDPKVKDELIKVINRWNQEMISNAKTTDKADRAIDLINKMTSALIEIIDKVSNNTDPTDSWKKFYDAKNAFLALKLPGLCGWGQPEENPLVVTKNGTKYFIIPGILFGNIFIGPEPLRGWDQDISKLYHSTVVPPPHSYLAWYAWVNYVFKANAQIHVGRHATYEWTPRKQYALASFDYPDICIGETPSIYIYIVDGVGEGMQAKRRGLSVIVDHLTPPMITTKLYSGLKELAGLVDLYEKVPEGNPLKDEYAKAIRQKIKELNLATDLGLNPENITDEDIDKVHDYLINLQSTLMPYGLHSFGENWTDDEIALLVSSMLSPDSESDPSIQHLLSDLHGFNWKKLTLTQAELLNNETISLIKELLKGKTPEELTINITDVKLREAMKNKLTLAMTYVSLLKISPSKEMDSLIDALNGGYIEPAKGGDPVRVSSSLPTGRNFYAQDDNTLPTPVAWDLGKRLADMALAQMEKIPEKIAAVVWCVETARDDGAMASFVLRMLGVEPKPDDKTWLGGGRLQYLVPTPLNKLLEDLNKVRRSMGLSNVTVRPRVDVITTTSGLFRDLFPNLLAKMDLAFRIALAASYSTITEKYPELKDELNKALEPLIIGQFYQAKNLTDLLNKYDLKEPLELNYVAKHWVELVKKGFDGDTAITRIFAPPVGDYGAGITHAVEQAWTWQNRSELADIYLRRMSHAYSNTVWGLSRQDLFEELLKGVSVAYHSRSTNLYGVLDNDDYYDYFGGLSMAIEKVNGGKAPQLNVLYYANPAVPQIMSLQQFMLREMRTRYLNPEWIKGMMKEGYSGARYISNKFVAYLWGWQVTTPHLVQDWMWNEIVDVYVKDKYNIGVSQWLSTGNRAYAMISIIGTLLTAAHRGFWHPSTETLRFLTNRWATLIARYGPACCDCSCGNIAMIRWALNYVNPNLLNSVRSQLYIATKNAAFAPSIPGAPTTPQPSIPGAPSQLGAPTALGRVGIGTAATRGVSPGISGPSGRVGGEIGARGAAQAAGAGGKAGITGAAAGKAYEITPVSKGIGKPGIPFAGIIGVIILIALIAAGYLLRRPEK